MLQCVGIGGGRKEKSRTFWFFNIRNLLLRGKKVERWNGAGWGTVGDKKKDRDSNTEEILKVSQKGHQIFFLFLFFRVFQMVHNFLLRYWEKLCTVPSEISLGKTIHVPSEIHSERYPFSLTRERFKSYPSTFNYRR